MKNEPIELLREIRRHNSSGLTKDVEGRIDAALSQQAKTVRSPRTEDTTTILATGSQEPAPAQDEQQPVADELRQHILHACKELTRQDRSPWHVRQQLEQKIKGLLAAPIAQTAPTPWQEATGRAAFKNFHRSLCERFGYMHDEEFWWRDLISLEEHIAKLAAPQPEQSGWISVEGCEP